MHLSSRKCTYIPGMHSVYVALLRILTTHLSAEHTRVIGISVDSSGLGPTSGNVVAIDIGASTHGLWGQPMWLVTVSVCSHTPLCHSAQLILTNTCFSMMVAAKRTYQLAWLRLVSGAARHTILSSERLGGFEWMCYCMCLMINNRFRLSCHSVSSPLFRATDIFGDTYPGELTLSSSVRKPWIPLSEDKRECNVSINPMWGLGTWYVCSSICSLVHDAVWPPHAHSHR